MGAVWAEKSARTLEVPEGRRPERKEPSNLRNGREKPWFEAPGTGKSKAGEGVGSLRFGPSFQGPALARQLAPMQMPPSNQKNESQSANNFYK